VIFRMVWLWFAVCLACGTAMGGEASFPGWQAMRVIEQEGRPDRAAAIDLDGDGREELLVVNSRLARIDVYRYLNPDQRTEDRRTDPDRPNELPLAPEFERSEVALERLPRDVLAVDVDGDGEVELAVLESPPNRIVLLEHDEEAGWRQRHRWDLLAGELSGRDRLMRLSPLEGETPELLISFDGGIQRLVLDPEQRASWLEPRERAGRADWWPADVDNDGDADLVEWTRGGDKPLGWYEHDADLNALLPARPLGETSVAQAAVVETEGPAAMMLLGGVQEGVLRQFRLGRGEPSEIGRQQLLPLPSAEVGHWTAMTLDGATALAAIDPEQPRLLVHRLADGGWMGGESFPIVSDVQAIAPLPSKPGSLLLHTDDAADLHRSEWKNGRFTFPRPWWPEVAGPPDAESDRKLLALGTAGGRTWWVQRVDDDLNLYLVGPDRDGPARHQFPDVGGKVDQARWLGPDENGRPKLLIMEQYARSPKLVRLTDAGEALVSEPPHLANASLGEFHLIPRTGGVHLARIRDGVLQWLDDDLQPVDQVMLPEGRRLIDYAQAGPEAAWALESGGRRLHRLEADPAGVMRLRRTHEIPGGTALHRSPVLGLLLTDRQRLIRLQPGRPHELELTDSLDGRDLRPASPRESTIHRLFVTDVDGDGHDELIASDDVRHELTVLELADRELKPLITWAVYEDKAYPYGQGEDQRVAEPRTLTGLDIDGDDKQDLAMLIHDRLLIYLAAEPGGKEEK